MLAVLVCGVSPARAQDTARDVLAFLLTTRAVVTDDFERDQAAVQAASDAIGDSLLLEIASVPLSTSSGGFSYRFNPALGTIERASRSFGAFFVERAVTAGRGRASAGVTFRVSSFGHLDGFDLRDGSFVTTANQFVDEATPFDQESLTLRLRTTTATGFVNVGLSDRLDVSVAVPVVWLSLEGERVDDFRGRRTVQASASADIAGLGDIAVRGKYRVGGERGTGVALGGEVRLPTGREEDLLGSGKVAFKGQAIASVEGPVAGVSFNAGYAGGGFATQFDYGVGLTIAPASRFTFSWEAFGRTLPDVGRLALVSLPHPTIAGVRTARLARDDSSFNSTATVVGFKWNVAGAWLVNGSLLVPIGDRGLRSGPAPAVSIEYAFGK